MGEEYTMKEAFNCLDKNRLVGFATVGLNGEPSNRIFQIAYVEGNSVYFLTSNEKEVYKELKLNPVTALTVATPDFTMIRITGKSEFVLDYDLKRKILDMNPTVKEIYGSCENPALELLRINSGKGSIFRMGQMPPTYDAFNY
jgi:uncharacterized pyridoxamine 5'-phosphate oxidase family protein